MIHTFLSQMNNSIWKFILGKKVISACFAVYEALRKRMEQKYQEILDNRAIEEPCLSILIVCYVILIFAGAVGNGLVCLAVARKPSMRTERNLMILNLAISDLFLVFITIPFSLVEIAAKYWRLGLFTCKLVAGMGAISIFVSTISISTIALERYKAILYPKQQTCSPSKTFVKLATIWSTAIVLASPLFFFRKIEQAPYKFPNLKVFSMPPLPPATYCLEGKCKALCR